ncbi:MAG: hypothetical protein ACKOBW_09490 [Planctomycetota bacterium]
MSERTGREIRFDRPERQQAEWREYSLDQFIAPDHRVRIIWRVDLRWCLGELSPDRGFPCRKPGVSQKDFNYDCFLTAALWLEPTKLCGKSSN